MKYLSTITFVLLLSLNLTAQVAEQSAQGLQVNPFAVAKTVPAYNWTKGGYNYFLGLLTGASNGLNQTLLHRYNQFKARHPHSNDQYWDPKVSWVNKYAGGEVANGPAYPGSTTIFASFTDANHLTMSIHRAGLVGMGALTCINLNGKKRPWWHYAISLGMGAAGYSIGFHAVWNGVYGIQNKTE